ncbi:MAG: metallophosphoesterase [Isosphaeraceae bacterium]
MNLPTSLNYPLIAIGDLHGQREELLCLLARIEILPEWKHSALVFLGDFVDRGEDVPGTIDLVLELLSRPAGGSAVMGNHDLALVRAARLDGGPGSPYWIESYRRRYDHDTTFLGYLGRRPERVGKHWERDLKSLKDEIPHRHREFLTSLPWVVETSGHLFLHCGLSPELGASPLEQVASMHHKQWDRSTLRPLAGTNTDLLWQHDYPVWIGADRNLSKSPLPYPGKVQVTGHVQVSKPDETGERIRLDTSGGYGALTACLLRSSDTEPEFFSG